MSPEDRDPCRACMANEHDEGQSFCDECEAQLEAELARRAIRSWDDLMEAWKGSVPESYANYAALSRDDSIQGLDGVKQHAESLGELLSRDSILYYAYLKFPEDANRRRMNMISQTPCRGCKVNERWSGLSLCDECAAQLRHELVKRNVRSLDDVMDAWQHSLPKSYATYLAMLHIPRMSDANWRQYEESLDELMTVDPILHCAFKTGHEQYMRAALDDEFAALDEAGEADALPLEERTTRTVEPAARGLPTSAHAGDYDIPAGYPANWNELRRMVYRRDNYTCQDRGETNARLVAHHVVPLWDDGSNELSNLVTLCESCHDRRHVVISANRRALRRELRRSQFRWDPQAIVAAIMVVLAAAWFIAYLLAH